MPTVAEVLKTAGLTDEQITALDAKAVTAFEGVLTIAGSERLEAEKAQRSAQQLFDEQITPALNSWGNKEANLQAERDYYKTLAEKAKDGGFVAELAPFKPEGTRNEKGEFVATTPGSPDMKKFEQQVVGGIGALTDLQWKYRKLFGEEMPDAPTALLAEAEANKMPFPQWAARKYGFDEKQKSIDTAKAQAHEEGIRKEERAKVEREFAERSPNAGNPNTTRGLVSNYAELKKGIADGQRSDPLKMTDAERSRATQESIRQDLASRMVQ